MVKRQEHAEARIHGDSNKQLRSEESIEQNFEEVLLHRMHEFVVKNVLRTAPETRHFPRSQHNQWCEALLDSSKPLDIIIGGADDDLVAATPTISGLAASSAPAFVLHVSSDCVKSVLLVLRGCTVQGVLETCLSKRHNVDYGSDAERKSPLAVPYRVRGVPAPRHIKKKTYVLDPDPAFRERKEE